MIKSRNRKLSLSSSKLIERPALLWNLRGVEVIDILAGLQFVAGSLSARLKLATLYLDWAWRVRGLVLNNNEGVLVDGLG